MYMKSLVSLAVLGAMSAVATAGDHVVFDNPNESYTVDRLSKYGATIKASDITITNTTYNGIDAYGVFDLNAANDISIQGATNGIFTPTDHENSSITIKTPKKLTITGPWAIHAEGKGTITIDAGDLVLRGSNGIAANSTGTVSIDAQTVDIASTNKYGVSSANTGGVTIKAEKSIYIKGGSANAVNGLQGAITLDSKGTTVVDGDILAKAATVSADFNGAGSSLTGAVITETSGTTTLGFSDGALWKAEGDSKVSELTLKGGVVDLNNHNVTAVNLANNSAATIRLDGAPKSSAASPLKTRTSRPISTSTSSRTPTSSTRHSSGRRLPRSRRATRPRSKPMSRKAWSIPTSPSTRTVRRLRLAPTRSFATRSIWRPQARFRSTAFS